MRKAILLIAAGLALVAGGCGEDNEAAGVGTGTTTTGTTTTAPAGDPDSTLDVSMTEFKFNPANPKVEAGNVEITAKNTGKTDHELILIKTDPDPSKLPKDGDEVSEEDSVGEIPETPAGQSGSQVFALEPGKYAMVCNIPGHYDSGMFGQVTVR